MSAKRRSRGRPAVVDQETDSATVADAMEVGVAEDTNTEVLEDVAESVVPAEIGPRIDADEVQPPTVVLDGSPDDIEKVAFIYGLGSVVHAAVLGYHNGEPGRFIQAWKAKCNVHYSSKSKGTTFAKPGDMVDPASEEELRSLVARGAIEPVTQES